VKQTNARKLILSMEMSFDGIVAAENNEAAEEKGLIDEYNIRVSPQILGRGKALFKNIQDRNKLSLIDVRQLKSGTVMLRYKA
jgi:riboflavin biosynthesis pyrimidine reductase